MILYPTAAAMPASTDTKRVTQKEIMLAIKSAKEVFQYSQNIFGDYDSPNGGYYNCRKCCFWDPVESTRKFINTQQDACTREHSAERAFHARLAVNCCPSECLQHECSLWRTLRERKMFCLT